MEEAHCPSTLNQCSHAPSNARLQNVEIRSHDPSPFHDAAAPFWSLACADRCPNFVPNKAAFFNGSYYEAFIYDYRLARGWVGVDRHPPGT